MSDVKMRELYLFRCPKCWTIIGRDAASPAYPVIICAVCTLVLAKETFREMEPVSYNRLSHQFQVKDNT